MDWIYSEIKPYLRGAILEIGCGIGTYSTRVIRDYTSNPIVVSDVDNASIEYAKKAIGPKPNVRYAQIDIENKKSVQELRQTFDSIFALNVLEHTKEDTTALDNVYSMLNKGGTFIAVVPVYPSLFNKFDQYVGHYRRYTKKDFLKKASQANFRAEKIFQINSAGIIGWWVNGNILNPHKLSGNGLKLLNVLIPFIRFFDTYVLRKRVGINLIAILKKE